MDRITAAIEAALAPALSRPESGADQDRARKAYQALKMALYQKFGPDSDLADAIEKLEKKPESTGRQALLREEIAAAGADQDSELLAAAQTVLDELANQIDGEQRRRPLSLPLQRPVRTEPFIDRAEALAWLLAKLQPEQIVALCGPAGIGKNALAAEAVWQLTAPNKPPAAFPAGIVYHNFYGQPRVDIALEQIARALGDEPVPTPYDAVQRILAERSALLVLDSADQADDLSGLLTVAGRSGMLLTSRQSLPSLAECRAVTSLLPDQSVTLLRSLARAQTGDKTVAARIGELVGGLPLALYLAGRYLAARPEQAGDYLAWLEQTPLAELDPDQRQEQSVPLLLEHSLAQVDQTAHQALAVASLLAFMPFDQAVVTNTLTLEASQGLLPAIRRLFRQKSPEKAPDVRLALQELAAYGLLRRVEQRYQVAHPLIHTYARQQLSPPPKAIRRLATYYVALAWEQSALGPAGYALLDLERPHIMKILDGCLASEDWEATHGLAVAVEDYLDRQGYWAERIIANEAGLMAAWQLGRPSEGAWLGNLGDTYRTMGHAKWAIEHFEKALATARQNGDRHGEGNSLGNLGLAYRDMGQIPQALEYLKQSQAIFEEVNSPRASLVQDWLIALSEENKDE